MRFGDQKVCLTVSNYLSKIRLSKKNYFFKENISKLKFSKPPKD